MALPRARRSAPSLTATLLTVFLTAALTALLALVGPAAEAAPSPLIAKPPAGSSARGPLVGIRADDGARVTRQKRLDRWTYDVTVRSPAVGHDLPMRVIVPPGWSPRSERTWPMVLALHGGSDNWTSWTRKTDIEQLARTWGVIVAMPEAGRSAAYTDYVRTTSQGPLRWETFHTVELMQILKRGFHTGNRRAVIGLSAGGYGAASYATRHPGMFQYLATYSGMLGVNQFPLQQLVLGGDNLQGTDTARYGVPILDQANWDAHDPYKLVRNLRGTGVYVYSGLTGVPDKIDTKPWTAQQTAEAWIGAQNQSFVASLMLNGIPVTSHFSLTGEHDWASWRRELHRSWPLAMAAIGARRA